MWETDVLDAGVVRMLSWRGDRSTISLGLAFLDLGPPSHPHGHMLSDLWLAIPSHIGMLTSTDLRLSESRNPG